MNRTTRATLLKRAALALAILALALSAAACSHLMMMGRDVQRPPTADFGMGPRASAKQLYAATLRPREPLKLRRLQTVSLLIVDAAGRPVENAAIAVDGGMPEHGHGLPTQPRVKRSLGAGMYEIEGLRFSMGGWWELKLAIESPAGSDNVTFNLAL